VSDLAGNKQLVSRFYREAINERDLDAVERLLTEDFVHNGEPRGRPGQREVVAVFLDGFSDLHNEILLILAEGDLVAAHQRWTGTHDGPFLEIPATGRRVEFTSTAVLRIEGDLIAEAWDESDMLGLTHQLS
jgi:predicted ester cyclase